MSFGASARSAGGVPVLWEEVEMSTPSCPSTQATDEANGLDPEQMQKDQKPHSRRLVILRAHHVRCEARYEAACVKTAIEENEWTSSLHQKGLMQSQQSSSESDDSIILGPTPAAVIQDMSVPELTRTNSVIVSLSTSVIDTKKEGDSTERDAATSSSRSSGQFGVRRRCTTKVEKNKDLPSAKERSDDEVPVAIEVSGNSNTTKGFFKELL
ncbi:uncharacterized protein LOC118558866 [Fundulus heteroclitus]|uniref:uncharacterized protein LOC118558866 n=1 Tax=Fundulus heteroclitus TaxID=8078 RepID=UPI00165B08A9|nr:uncharacterized protein LOC118558866 [Fundulus heteroclitus]